jgi:hypothetical protein
MKFNYDTESRFAHKTKIARYQKMLAGHLTPSERDFVERRVEEEQGALRKLAEGVVVNPR